MNPPSSSLGAQSPGLKTYFKTPEGRYKLQYEKTHPAGLLHYSHGKSVSQVRVRVLIRYSPISVNLLLKLDYSASVYVNTS